MDEHRKALTTLCRVCGCRCVKWPASQTKHGLEKSRYEGQLYKTYKIDINKDIADIHPLYLCTSCAAATTPNKNTYRPIIGWTEHTESCKACTLMNNSIGRRKLKPAKVAAKRRREREEEMKAKNDIDKACDLLLQVSSYAKTHTKMQRLATNVVKVLIDEEDLVELPTGGPKFVLKKIIIPRIPSNEASERTVRARVTDINKHVKQISSADGSEEAALHQLSALLRGKTKQQLREILHSEGLLKIRIPAGNELSFKAQMGWTWNEMRKLKSWLKAYKVQMVCEGKSRQMKKDLVGNNIEGDMIPFLVKENDETVTKLAPMVYIPDLEGHIMQRLDDLERQDMLVWDHIPEDEIWIKIGGDGGGGSTKMYYQIVNTAKTNSIKNTVAFCVYQADERVCNLHTALDQYIPQIASLKNANWRGKTIVLWMIGDYEFQRKILGLQGASATFPCIFCHAKKDDLDSNDDAETRDLDSINSDYRNVVERHCTTKAKQMFHSVSHQPFFDIPLDKVCPPSLHLTLGLWGKFFTNLEKDLQQLGQLIAEDLASQEQPSTSAFTNAFTQHITVTKHILKEIQEKEEKAEDLREKAVDLEYQLMTQSLVNGPTPDAEQMKEIEDLYRQSNKLLKETEQARRENKLENETNPLIQQLDDTLQSFKVRRQSYHSKSFVGNHVAKCLKVENYTSLLDEVVKKTRELTPNEDLHDKACSIQMAYMLLFEKYSTCYNAYSSCESLTSDQIDQLETDIEALVSYYKSRFHYFTFTPKFHILFKHVIPFMRLTGFGLGKLSEHGGEQLHHLFNVLGRQLEGVKNIQINPPELQHLKAVFEEHLISCHPLIQGPKETEA